MGIQGLLPFLKDAISNVNIKQFEGSTVAVDTYCWIYRGAFGCAEQLALGHTADGHVKYVLRYVNKLLEWGIKPIMVFDGSCLPSKKNTEAKRKESKEMYRRKAAQCLLEGRKNEARECFQRCIECTPKMALEVIMALHSIGVDVLVAPYEADAQLAYLNKINLAQIIITEDSDLILFGCEKILYKLDINGNGQLIQKEKIVSITKFNSADNFERFRWMCILSGCDYLENLPGIGLGKARKFLQSVQKSDLEQLLKQMPRILKMPNLIVSNEYVENFKKADKTFKYQIVFDPLLKKLVSLHTYQEDIEPKEDLSYAGLFYDDDTALQHSLGNLDVNTRQPVNNFDPSNWNHKPPIKYFNNPPPHMKSIWSKSYKPFNSSNPFSGCFKLSSAKKENFPSTAGLCKKISNPNYSNDKKSDVGSNKRSSLLNESSNLNKDNIVAKRKFDMMMMNNESKNSNRTCYEESSQSQFTASSSLSSMADSDYATDLNENDLNENDENTISASSGSDPGVSKQKRLRTEEIKNDIDNLLNEYYLTKPPTTDVDTKDECLESNETKPMDLGSQTSQENKMKFDYFKRTNSFSFSPFQRSNSLNKSNQSSQSSYQMGDSSQSSPTKSDTKILPNDSQNTPTKNDYLKNKMIDSPIINIDSKSTYFSQDKNKNESQSNEFDCSFNKIKKDSPKLISTNSSQSQQSPSSKSNETSNLKKFTAQLTVNKFSFSLSKGKAINSFSEVGSKCLNNNQNKSSRENKDIILSSLERTKAILDDIDTLTTVEEELIILDDDVKKVTPKSQSASTSNSTTSSSFTSAKKNSRKTNSKSKTPIKFESLNNNNNNNNTKTTINDYFSKFEYNKTKIEKFNQT